AREEVTNVFRRRGHHARPASVCPTQQTVRQSSARMAVSNFPAWRFNLLIRNKAHPPQSRFLMQGQGKVIDPLKKIRAGLVKHALGKLSPKGIAVKKSLDGVTQKTFSFVGQRPVKAPWRRRIFLFQQWQDQHVGSVVVGSHHSSSSAQYRRILRNQLDQVLSGGNYRLPCSLSVAVARASLWRSLFRACSVRLWVSLAVAGSPCRQISEWQSAKFSAKL